MRNLQRSGAVSLRVKQDSQKQQATILTFRGKDVPTATLEVMNPRRATVASFSLRRMPGEVGLL